jgi:hypothetical protein
MNQQPDKLFRDKLENFQHAAPSGAWEKIAGQQSTRNTGRTWLRVAAALLLLAMAGIYGWNQFAQRPASPTLAEKYPQTKKDPEPAAVPPGDMTGQQGEPLAKANPTATRRPDAITQKPKGIEKEETTPQEKLSISPVEESILDATVSVADNTSTELTAQINADQLTIEDPNLAVAQSPTSITLVFTVSDVNDYKEKSGNDATPEDKKPSTLKKLLRKANELTNNQDPLGDLRQKKNEILALNFKSDKQRGQNK